MPRQFIIDFSSEVGHTYRRAAKKDRLMMLGFAAVAVLGFGYIGWAVAARLLSERTNIYGVTGTVTVGGESVEAGEVIFDPVAGENTQRRSAQIRNGAFELLAAAGVARKKTYTIRVFGYKRTGLKYENADPGQSAEQREQFIAPQFNSSSKLRFVSNRANLAAPLMLELPDSADMGLQSVESK